MKRIITKILASTAFVSMLLAYPLSHVYADQETPYGVHEPVQTGLTDDANIVLYVIAFTSFIFGLFMIINSYYLRSKLSKKI